MDKIKRLCVIYKSRGVGTVMIPFNHKGRAKQKLDRLIKNGFEARLSYITEEVVLDESEQG